ncbi:unnamed protein product [Pocillopora meandrina]|uniref:Uncharacterized protein n=1 Tax=Pocillopora meandrina TaxID=46732 RepID=A0AAU9Y637_9CNID|nr:unnamed protein product [Pocillopora meandrina]
MDTAVFVLLDIREFSVKQMLMNAYQENTIVPQSANVSILWVHISAHIVDLDILTMERPVKITGKRSTPILSASGQKMTTSDPLKSKRPVKSTHSNLSIQMAP